MRAGRPTWRGTASAAARTATIRRCKSMHGLFVAAGPGVARGVVAPEFENIHIYDFLCGVLGLTPAKNDGDPAVTRAFLTR